MHHQANIR